MCLHEVRARAISVPLWLRTVDSNQPSAAAAAQQWHARVLQANTRLHGENARAFFCAIVAAEGRSERICVHGSANHAQICVRIGRPPPWRLKKNACTPCKRAFAWRTHARFFFPPLEPPWHTGVRMGRPPPWPPQKTRAYSMRTCVCMAYARAILAEPPWPQTVDPNAYLCTVSQTMHKYAFESVVLRHGGPPKKTCVFHAHMHLHGVRARIFF